MSLSLRERLILLRIERELRHRDPHLAALFDTHGSEPRPNGTPVPPSPDELPGWLLIVMASCVLAVAVIVALLYPSLSDAPSSGPSSGPDATTVSATPGSGRQVSTLEPHRD
ncbi:DUF3040 domain-containing protein [Spirillospora sp. NPDC000708]